ncbi:hypothetical protein RFI_21975 [Reticulomyxa filosa]|uniref:USP domain-containing protein n=1 Tax=Reticulomyxa filosa TaxID=46433 RepID=X6MPR4_RETFI|nr:hypothetical protein RFI_21975 [Reticulomyxa filosa]|eukprot:ETO15392.1 hypothetical protein RFI_21975 [Reticulomyxa filosa]
MGAALHEDLNQVTQKPYLNIPDFDQWFHKNYEKEDESNMYRLEFQTEYAQHRRDLHLQRNKSHIEELFGGMLRSTVRCPCCHFVSITFDPFMHLLLPVRSFKHLRKSLYRPLVQRSPVNLTKSNSLLRLSIKYVPYSYGVLPFDMHIVIDPSPMSWNQMRKQIVFKIRNQLLQRKKILTQSQQEFDSNASDYTNTTERLLLCVLGANEQYMSVSQFEKHKNKNFELSNKSELVVNMRNYSEGGLYQLFAVEVPNNCVETGTGELERIRSFQISFYYKIPNSFNSKCERMSVPRLMYLQPSQINNLLKKDSLLKEKLEKMIKNRTNLVISAENLEYKLWIQPSSSNFDGSDYEEWEEFSTQFESWQREYSEQRWETPFDEFIKHFQFITVVMPYKGYSFFCEKAKIFEQINEVCPFHAHFDQMNANEEDFYSNGTKDEKTSNGINKIQNHTQSNENERPKNAVYSLPLQDSFIPKVSNKIFLSLCSCCKTLDTFMSQDSTVNKLEECFGLFVEKEFLDENNPWFCPKCKKHQTEASKNWIYGHYQIS